MRIRRAESRAFVLPLVRSLSTAHGRIDSREGFFIRLTEDQGHRGCGEATPLASFGTEDRPTSEAAISRSLGELTQVGEIPFEEALRVNARACREAASARAAVDAALHDLAAQCAGVSLAAFIRRRAGLPGEPASKVRVQAIVAGDDPSEVHSSAGSLLADGFEAFKLKLALSGSARDLGRDLERVAALRGAVGPSSRIRLDANEAWSFEEASAALAAFEGFDIDFVEQPVGRGEFEALKALGEQGTVSVAADEALLDAGWEECLEKHAASIFVVKPAALGGLDAVLDLSRRAREQGVRVIWSSLIDGVVSRAFGIALAAALGSEGEVHGLGTTRLLARDLVSGVEPEGSTISLSSCPGLDWPSAQLRREEDEIWRRVEIVESGS